MASNLVCVLVGVFSRQPRVKNIKSKGGDLYQRHLFENQELSYNHKNFQHRDGNKQQPRQNFCDSIELAPEVFHLCFF